jgi:hypothetical protein
MTYYDMTDMHPILMHRSWPRAMMRVQGVRATIRSLCGCDAMMHVAPTLIRIRARVSNN